MATKFLDYTGLSYLWGKVKAWCNATFVHLATDENITGTKTFVGSKKIAFKQSTANDKLGFTLYNNSSKEQGYLEYNPTNKIANVPLFTLGNYATAADELTYIGFRRYSNISGASGAYNLLAPLISDAKTPFNLTTTYTNFYLPLGISDGTSIITASNSGVIDISSFLTLTGYTKPSTGSALATTDTIIEALGKLEVKVDAVDQSNVVHRTGNETINGTKTFVGDVHVHKDTLANQDNIIIKNDSIDITTGPSSGITYNALACLKDVNDRYISTIQSSYSSSGVNGTYITARSWVDNNYNSAQFTIVASNTGVRYATLNGYFSLLYSSPIIALHDVNLTKGTNPNPAQWAGVTLSDSDATTFGSNKRFGAFEGLVDTDGTVGVYMRAYDWTADSTANAAISVHYTKGGSGYTAAPTPAASDNSTKIATTAWVRTFCDTTQKYMKAVSVTGSGNAVTAISVSGHTITVTKGSTFLTSHQSLANYLTKLTNVSEMGRYIDMHYDNATATNDYDVRLEVTSLGSSSGKGSFSITCDNFYLKSVSPAFCLTDSDANVTTKTDTHWGCVYGRDKNAKDFGRFFFDTYNTSGTTPEFITGLTVNSGGSNNTMCSLALRAQWNATVGYSFGPWGVSSNSNIRLGESNRKWKEIWSVATSLNSSSDERVKNEIVDIPDEVLIAWEDAKWIRFKYNDAINEKGIENARYHTGMIAQQIQHVFQSKNIDIDKYGFFLYDEWEGQEATYDEYGNEKTPYEASGNSYGLRYTEALCIEAAYQRRKNKILENRISELEKQVSDMLQILQSLKGAN